MPQSKFLLIASGVLVCMLRVEGAQTPSTSAETSPVPNHPADAAAIPKHPCKDSRAYPEYRQLDFWLGDWDAFSGTKKVGESEIKLILGDCVVFENWKDRDGGEGKSFNKYNNEIHQWEQFWVEDDGSTQYFKGNLVDGELRYVFDQTDTKGVRTMRHLNFSRLPDDRVRQFCQKSSDGGSTWVTEYDLTYVRKKVGASLQ